MKAKKLYATVAIVLTVYTFLVGVGLFSSKAFADDSVVTTTTITVPIACTMRGVGMNTHTATLAPGTYSGASGSEYEDGIGKTTLTAICNDDNGFSIYAVGYTGNEYGVTSLIGQNTNGAIVTKAYASGDTTSNWSMKTTKIIDATESYNPQNLTIQNSFDAWHAVPADYTEVARYKANTGSSTTDTTLGVRMETTYAAYIASNQPADTYIGQVKYTLVHPYDAAPPVDANQVGVIYDANGSTFADGETTNRVVYGDVYSPLYIKNTPTIVSTSNIDLNGDSDAPYTDSEYIHQALSFEGAVKIKAVLNYSITADTMYVCLSETDNEISEQCIEPIEENETGTNTYIFDGDMISVGIISYGAPDTDYDYGAYIQLSPIYSSEQPDTTEMSNYDTGVITGTYSTTTPWYGSWYTSIDNNHFDFTSEEEIISFLDGNPTLSGTTIRLYRGRTFAESYQVAGKTQIGGYYTLQDLNKEMCHTVAISQIATVTDNRDDNVYDVVRIKDGNCWMRNNLRLDPTESTTASNMSPENTNASAAVIANYLNGGGGAAGWSNVPVSNVSSGFNSFVAPMVNNDYQDVEGGYIPDSETTISFGKYGLFYNYCAATMGTYCYDGSQGQDIPETNIDAIYDICPANWRMPTENEYGSLLYMPDPVYGYGLLDSDLQSSLLLLVGAGYYSGNRRINGGDFDMSYTWASTFSVTSNSYMRAIQTIREESSDGGEMYYIGRIVDGSRSDGLSVRCLVSN